ncbi:MAG TPA: heme-binding protein [Burkholderiaceae bacterium]|nr:heme-binding protein [Burkholderiaceae bacterium]
MKTKPLLTLDDVNALLAGAQAEAIANGWKVSIAVCDDGGHLLGFLRLDDAPIVSATIAIEKARTSIIGRRSSKAYEDMVAGGRMAALSMPMVTHLEGGEPIVTSGAFVGAVGVSGVKSSEDAQIARAGIATWRTKMGAPE